VTWITVRVVPARARDEIVTHLISEGASCVQEEGDALVTSFPESSLPRSLAENIAALDSGASVTLSPAPELSFELHGTVTAHRIGNLFVVPTWEAGSYPAEMSIVIEPGGAFGTGDHATTRGVLHLLQDAIRSGDTVADLGAGSAVLSIAAAKLGAARVVAVELDHDAIANAEENVEANGVSGIVTVIEGDAALILPLLAPVDVILANIVSGVLVGMLGLFRSSVPRNGHAILSGVLVAERAMMVQAFNDSGWSIEREHSEGEWWSVLITPR
jgi:ribosomal protein L11 methyltransferase